MSSISSGVEGLRERTVPDVVNLDPGSTILQGESDMCWNLSQWQPNHPFDSRVGIRRLQAK
jgi:hypothetical protein